MISLYQSSHSFVIRIWWEQTGPATDSRPIWRAWVQHAGTGETRYVDLLTGLLAFIEAHTGALEEGGGMRNDEGEER